MLLSHWWLRPAASWAAPSALGLGALAVGQGDREAAGEGGLGRARHWLAVSLAEILLGACAKSQRWMLMGALPTETLISWVNQTCASQYRLCLVFLQILLYFQNLALGVFAPGVAGSGLLWLSLFVSSLAVLAVIHFCLR